MSIIKASGKKVTNYISALKSGMEVSSGAKSTATYYHKKEDQVAAIKKAVSSLYDVDKTLPILLACMDDATEFFRQEVIRNELKSGYDAGKSLVVDKKVWYDQKLQEKMLTYVMDKLPTTYALRLFKSFRDDKINNSRTSDKLQSWVLANLNDFTAVKYQSKFRDILRHAWGQKKYSWVMSNMLAYIENKPYDASQLNKMIFNKYGGDNSVLAKLLLFIDKKGKPEWYKGLKYVNAYYNAANASTQEDFYNAAKFIDITVAQGLVSTNANPLFKEMRDGKKIKKEVKKKLLENSKVISDDQKVRTKGLQKRVGATVRSDVDYSKVNTETLYKTEGLDTQKKERVKAEKLNLPYKHVAVIQDVSLSNRGSVDSANTAAVVIEHLASVLKESAEHVIVEKTPEKQTDLTKPLIEAIKKDPELDAIFVLSDGYENFPYEGCFNDFIGKLKEDGMENLHVIHCSPYSAAEMVGKSRELGSNITSFPATKPSQIKAQMDARLLEFNPTQYLEDAFSKYLTQSQRIELRVVEEML